MEFVELKEIVTGYNFSVFDNAEYVGGICAPRVRPTLANRLMIDRICKTAANWR
jgi:hypothetical protein